MLRIYFLFFIIPSWQGNRFLGLLALTAGLLVFITLLQVFICLLSKCTTTLLLHKTLPGFLHLRVNGGEDIICLPLREQRAICLKCIDKKGWDGDVAQLAEHRTGTPPTQVRFPGAARDFLPESTFSADSLTVSTPHPHPCAVACIYICAHVKDPVVHVRVR